MVHTTTPHASGQMPHRERPEPHSRYIPSPILDTQVVAEPVSISDPSPWIFVIEVFLTFLQIPDHGNTTVDDALDIFQIPNNRNWLDFRQVNTRLTFFSRTWSWRNHPASELLTWTWTFIVLEAPIKGKGLQSPGTNFEDKTLKHPEITFRVLSEICYKFVSGPGALSP